MKIYLKLNEATIGVAFVLDKLSCNFNNNLNLNFALFSNKAFVGLGSCDNMQTDQGFK